MEPVKAQIKGFRTIRVSCHHGDTMLLKHMGITIISELRGI